MLKDLSLYRLPPIKSEEWIDNYLTPTDFSKFDTNNLFSDFKDFIIKNSKTGYIENYNLNGVKSDFYLPNLKLAIKFIDLYNHCELNVDKKNQFRSYTEYENNDIHLVQIFEDLWRDKSDIIKSRLSNLFGNSTIIWARKCKVVVFKDRDNKVVNEFIRKSHLQGAIGSFIKLGLIYNDEIVSVMTFGKLRKNLGQKNSKDDYELLRFCSKVGHSIIGAATRLFDYFVKNYSPKSIITYADMMWSNRNSIYKKMGLEFIHKSDPSYFYIVGGVRKNRFGYRKNVLLECGYDGRYWGEHDICYSNGLYRIFDAGTEKFLWNK